MSGTQPGAARAAGPLGTLRQRLGDTSLHVSPLCLGGNRLGSELDERASFELLDRFVTLGGNFVDTALVYADWVEGVEPSCSERTIGRWLADRGHGPEVVVATKGGHHDLRRPGTPRLDRGSLRTDVTASVEHLGRPVDLYYLHRDDPATPVDELLETLEGFVAEGLVRHYAASNFGAARLRAALDCARRNGVAGFCADQLEWSLAAPDPDHVPADLVCMDEELAELHRAEELPVVPYSAQARGYFERVLGPGPLPPHLERFASGRNRDTALVLDGLARRYGVNRTSLALTGLMACGVQVVPVIGCRTPAQLERSWEAVDLLAHLEPDDAGTLGVLAWSAAAVSPGAPPR